MDGILMSSRPKGWPRHAYPKRAGSIFFGCLAVFAAWMFEWQYEWTGMQKYYLAHYVVANTGLIHCASGHVYGPSKLRHEGPGESF